MKRKDFFLLPNLWALNRTHNKKVRVYFSNTPQAWMTKRDNCNSYFYFYFSSWLQQLINYLLLHQNSSISQLICSAKSGVMWARRPTMTFQWQFARSIDLLLFVPGRKWTLTPFSSLFLLLKFHFISNWRLCKSK